MKWISFIIAVLFASQAFADLERWQKWEVERNDLQFNSQYFHKLPSKQELESYQIEKLLMLKVDPKFVGVIALDKLPPGLITADGKIKFFIHPSSKDLFKELIPHGELSEVKAFPTSSPRTFFVEDFMVKISLSDKINGAIRTVYPLQMQRATAINQMLSEISEVQKKSAHFSFLPEPAGIFDKTPDSPFGFVVREIPESISKGKNTLVPLLSLVAKSQGGSSLLESSAAASNLSPVQLVEQKILPALLESFSLAVQHGVILEAHQQNTLLELDEKGRCTGKVFYRDLDGARVDFEIRKAQGLPVDTYLKMQDAAWVFDLESLQQIRKSVTTPAGRPAFWSGVAEKSLQTYLLGSSVYLLRQSLQSEPDFSNLRIEKTIRESLRSLSTKAPMCRAVFL